MKNGKKLFGIILYIISFFTILFYLYIELNNFSFNPIIRASILLLNCFIMYFGGTFVTESKETRKKILKLNLIIWFLLYIVFLLSITLFDTYFNRNGISIFKIDKEIIDDYVNTSFNIEPFKTIKLYFNSYSKGYLDKSIFMYNIVGNLLALMPFAFFLPLLFKHQNNYLIYLTTIILIVIAIEGLQFLTLSGSCDIDDLILNVLGSSCLYFIFKIKPIKKIIRKIFVI